MKKLLSYIISIILITGSTVFAQSEYISDKVIEDTALYLQKSVTEPQLGSVGGEWTVIGLAGSNTDVPDEYYSIYYKNVEEYVKANNGILHNRKYTEYSRVIIALTAIGKNPADVAGYNLLMPLGDYEKTVWQGVTGAAWALIALDSGNYDIPQNPDASVQATRELYINHILECEKGTGGWSLSDTAETSDPDVTAMSLIALSNYRNSESVNSAIERGVEVLSHMQNGNGGYSSYDTENAESTAQVLTAISILGISYNDKRFIKNNNTIIDNIMSYYQLDNGFSHTDNPDLMATEQCFYSLVAAKRLGDNPLFRMSDRISFTETETRFGLSDKNPDIAYQAVKYNNKTFDDISDHKNRTAIEALAQRGIINGMMETCFSPDNTMTRAEFAAIITRGLGLPLKKTLAFTDVSENDWYYDYIATAYTYGIVNGVSETEFNANGIITKEEAAVMISRAAKLCGMVIDINTFTAKNILAEFVDYVKISDWAVSSVAFCYNEDILDRNELEINPKTAVTRAEIAQMLYNMLGKAELI